MKTMKQPSYTRLLLGPAFALVVGLPCSAHAQLSPNPNYGTIDISGPAYSGAFQNYGEVRNYGSLETYDTFSNAGLVSNYSGARFDNYGSLTTPGPARCSITAADKSRTAAH
jgi:hypothetical protein